MVCNTCGRYPHSEDANFCEYCGSSYKENVQAAIKTIPQKPIAVIPENVEKPISLLNWLGTYGLFFIPIIGWLVFLVMLFVWAFSNDASASKKNWARATLILIPVTFVILLILLVLLTINVMNDPMFQQMMNGTFDYNSYYNSLY